MIEIDYLKKIMNLYDPRTYHYPGEGEIVTMLVDGRRIPFLQTTIIFEKGPPVEGSLEVDTGADRTIIFSSPFRGYGLVRAGKGVDSWESSSRSRFSTDHSRVS